jgi:hypothetical protein
MAQIFEALYREDEAQATPEQINNNEVEIGSIKMMDTILFEGNFKPNKWIFTDLLGRIQFKDIKAISVNDVIRAFLVNLNDN